MKKRKKNKTARHQLRLNQDEVVDLDKLTEKVNQARTPEGYPPKDKSKVLHELLKVAFAQVAVGEKGDLYL